MAALSPNLRNIHHLRGLPVEWLRPSALVDFVLLFACGKPAVRVTVDTQVSADALHDWCRKVGLDFASDDDHFACVSIEPDSARRVMEIDRLPEAHEIDLGRGLGYPICCCERIATLGEPNIDSHAAEVARWPFDGLYRRINPVGYSSGRALISHLPCSPTCEASLRIANRARRFVLEHASEPLLAKLCSSPVVCE
jgi:hypothetical protein